MVTRRATAIRLTFGTILGSVAWPVIGALLTHLPMPLRFAIAWFLFTFGPGVVLAGDDAAVDAHPAARDPLVGLAPRGDAELAHALRQPRLLLHQR